MTLRITPNTQPYEELYSDILASIPEGMQWHKGPVVLPLPFSSDTPFLIEGDPGDVVQVYQNDRLIRTVVLDSPSLQIFVRLVPGKNFIQVRSPAESFLLLVVATNYATILRGYSEEYFYNIDVDFQDANNQLNSELSLRAVEHQISFQNLLPPTRAMRVLAGKLAVRSLVNETATTRGVDDIVTAASNTTPVVRPTVVDLEFFEPSVRDVFSTAHDEGGFAFHIWTPNLCIGSWAAFIKLMDNLDPAIAELKSVSDELVRLDFLGFPESHTFDFDTGSCSIIDLLTQDCLPIVVSVALTVESELAFCAWRYPFDVVSELALGRLRLDSASLFSEVISPASFLQDLTGAATGIIGAYYVELSNHPESIVYVTVIDPLGGALIPSVLVPGTRRMVLTSGNPGRPIFIRYEGSLSFDSGIPLDSCEESDPLCDGWYGLPLVDRFDGESCLDSTIPEVDLFADLECCFSRPQATLAVSSLMSVDVNISSRSFSGLTILP